MIFRNIRILTLSLVILIIAITAGSCGMVLSSANVGEEDNPLPVDPEWETPLLASDLPALQLHQGGNHALDWKFANMLKGTELWLISTDGDVSESRAEYIAGDVEVDELGWPLWLPSGFRFQAQVGYPVSRDVYNNSTYLTGVYVLTWDGEGDVRLSGIQYQGGAELLYRGPGRIVLKIVSDQDYPVVSVYSSTRSDHVRNMKLWAPEYDGAGLDLTYEDDLGQGRIRGSLEPAPGERPVFWHPEFLRHMRETDGYDVIRFMGWLSINGINEFETVSWTDRSVGDYAGISLSVIDEDWNRVPVTSFKQQIGTPYEWIVDLCNILGKDMWIQVPHTADAGFPAKLARYLLGEEGYPGLRSDLRVWIELSNEIWNTAEAYLPQAEYAMSVAADAMGLNVDDLEYMGPEHAWGAGHIQGKFLQRFEDSWKSAGGTDARLINVVAGFLHSSTFNERQIAAVKEIRETLPEVLAVTTYFGAGFDVTGGLHAILPQVSDAEIVNWQWTDADFAAAHDVVQRDLWTNYGSFTSNVSVANDNGMHLVCYEGGQHVLCFGFADWDNPNHEKFMRFVEAFERSSYMADLYLEQWSLWTAAGGRTASLFVDVGSYAVWGYWGARETIFDDSEKWNAFLDWADIMDGVRAPGEPIGTSPELPDMNYQCQAGDAWQQDVTVAGGDGGLFIAVLGGGLPPGVTFTDLGNGTARFEGTPASHGNFRCIVQVLDGDLDPDYGICTIQVDPEGTDTNGIFFFTGTELPYSTDPDFSDRWDILRETTTASSPFKSRTLSFSLTEPLYGYEYHNDGNPLYDLSAASENFSMNMYGGFRIRVEESLPSAADGPSAWVGLRSRHFEAWVGHNETVSGTSYHLPSIFDLCVVWQKNQFMFGNGTYSFGSQDQFSTLRIDLDSISDTSNDIRFVILHHDGTEASSDGVTWYVSEAMYSADVLGANSYFQLTGFDNSGASGKRWAVLPSPPSGQNISMPEASTLNFAAKDFTDVRGVGFIYHGTRFGYHWLFAFNRFFALGEVQ